MEYILLFIIILQFAYILFKDKSFADERERMQLKIMSKDVREYKDSIEGKVEETPKKEEVERMPVEEATAEELLKAINKV